MRTYPLRTYDLPDVSDHLIHFTGRVGPKMAVDPVIANMQAQQRLARILVDGVLRGFETFGADAPVVCFTESTKQAVPRLLLQRRYEPCGIAFSKQFVFDNGGGPALYVRGDEWVTATQGLPQPRDLCGSGQGQPLIRGNTSPAISRRCPSGYMNASGALLATSTSPGATLSS
jgi:hypothetical protein